MRVYISSTNEDLNEYRRSVIDALLCAHYEPVCMEHFKARDSSPKEEVLKDVSGCDIYIGIFAWRYGFIPPQCEISITEMEYREAVKLRIPTLIFLLDEKVTWPAKHKEKGDNGKRIRDLRKELQDTKWIGFFTSKENLVINILEALGPLASERIKEEFIKARKISQKQKNLQKNQMQNLQREKSQVNKVKRVTKSVCLPYTIPERLIRHFTDRVQELAELQRCLSDRNLRMVLISGRSGMGKTTLVTKLIHELKSGCRNRVASSADNIDGIVHIPLGDAGYRTLDRVIELISEVMDSDNADNLKIIWNQERVPLQDRLAGIFNGPLTQQRYVIILDNLESLMHENQISQDYFPFSQFIEAFLEYDHSSLLIATSRTILSLSPEVEIASIGRWIKISLENGLPENFAISLFRKLDPEGRLGIRDTNDEVLVNLVHKCLGIPRTIESLVATLLQHPTWTLDTLLANKSLLNRLIDYPARELYASLPSDQDRLVVQALAVYGKPVPSGAIHSILPALPVDQILDDLFRNFVVTHSRGQFWLHPLDQQYAYEQIPDQGSEYSKSKLHILAAEFYRSIACPRTVKRSTLEEILPDLDALDHLLKANQGEDAFGLLINNDLYEDLFWWGYFVLLSDLYRRFLNLNISSDRRIFLHIQLGKVQRNLGNLREAKKTFESALPFLTSSVDPKSEIGLYIALGDINYYLSEYDHALEYQRQAEQLLVTNPNPLLQSENTGDMANVMYSKGNYNEALEMYNKAIDFSREAAYRKHEGIWQGGIGLVHCSLFDKSGDPIHRDKALFHFLESIKIAREELDRRHESHYNGVLGSFYNDLGENEKAKEHLKIALTIAKKISYGRVFFVQSTWLESVYKQDIRKYLVQNDFKSALYVAGDFQRTVDEIGIPALVSTAEQYIYEIKICEIRFLIGSNEIEAAVLKYSQLVSSSFNDVFIYQTLAEIGEQEGRQKANKELLQLTVDAYTKAIALCSNEFSYPLYEGRANTYAVLGKFEEAIADYTKCLNLNPEKIGAALSRAEVLIWAGKYNDARISLVPLSLQPKTTGEEIIYAWLMCHINNLKDKPYSDYRKIIKDKISGIFRLNYNVRDIENYLDRLDRKKFNEKQISNAWEIQKLFENF